MGKIGFVCIRDVVHNGVHYKSGQHWDGDDPPPQVGDFWSIWQNPELTPPSTASIRWVPQPARPRAAPLTAEELKRVEANPYDPLDELPAAPAPSAPDPPLTGEKKEPTTPTISSHLLMSEAELDDTYGLRAQAAAREAELRKGSEEKEQLADPPEK